MNKFRTEEDSLGKIKVGASVYYGSHTQRSLNTFLISGLAPYKEYILATVLMKKAAANVNSSLSLLSRKNANVIISVCNEILNGKFEDQFTIDMFQAGAGTSHNMNVNEVIANRANQLMGAPLGSYQFIHPNDHVNMSQSTNDVIPAAIRVAALMIIPDLLRRLTSLEKAFSLKSKEFSEIIKAGRTHLQDALPVTLGQEFGAYAKAIHNDILRIETVSKRLLRLGIGGTAVGSGINTHPKYHTMMIDELSRLTRLPLVSSGNLFESMQNTSDFLDCSSALKIVAQNLIRIGQDLRLLSSGPGSGYNELTLPAILPGSSIIPGKVNPTVAEMLIMVCFQIIGFDEAITLASLSGQLELNVMLPIISYNLLSQVKLLTNAANVFDKQCVSGIQANKKMCNFWFERSVGIAAILNPLLGYAKTALLVKEAVKTGKTINELVLEKKYLTRQQAKKIFNVKFITKPNR
jgi:fumarate hydratase, class II